MEPKRGHHPSLSPSSLPALKECPCFVSAPSGEAAAEGTRQHDVLEKTLNGIPVLVGEDDMGALWAADWVRSQLEEVGGIMYVEEELSVMRGFEELTYGTADIVIVPEEDFVVVDDYKSGERRVYDAQLATYGLAAMQRFNKSRCKAYVLYGKYRSVDLIEFCLEEAENMVYGIVNRVQSLTKTPVACDYCSWCSKCAACSAINNVAMQVAGGYEPTLFQEWHPSKIDDPDEMGRMADACSIVEAWVKSVKYRSKEMAMQGRAPTGWGLTKGKTYRSVRNIEGLFKETGIDPESFFSCCDVGFEKLQAATGKSKKDFDLMVAPFIESKTGEMSLKKNKRV